LRNTLPSGHVERCECCPMLLISHVFLRFLLRCPAHAFVSWCGLFLSLQGYQQLDTGCFCFKLQTDPFLPLFLEPKDCNIGTTHSGTLSVFVQLQSWLCVGRFCQMTIFFELYGNTLSDVSDHGDNESLHSDSDVPTTSSHKRLWSSTGPLTPQFPHTFFLTSIKTIFITLWD